MDRMLKVGLKAMIYPIIGTVFIFKSVGYSYEFGKYKIIEALGDELRRAEKRTSNDK